MKRPGSSSKIRSYVVTFIVMMGFWMIFSGKFDLFHLSLGVVSCLLVTIFSHDLLFPTGFKTNYFVTWIKFIGYIPWLLYQILLANLHLLRLCFHPRMTDLIDPHIIEFSSRLESDNSRTTFANSITLTPGSITVNITVMGKFTVHCIDRASGEPLPGEMEPRIAGVFSE